MGNNEPRPRRQHAYAQTGDEASSDSEEDTDLDEEGYAQFAREEEEALVDSAMRRIWRAPASGKKEVKLSRRELAALENHRKRQTENESRRKKRRDQRYAVPISHFAPISQKENRTTRMPGTTPPTESMQTEPDQPPVERFTHPSSSRPASSPARQPASNKMSDREGSTSPFQYHYVRAAAPVSNPRHSSDPTARRRSSSVRANLPYPEKRASHYNPSSSVQSVPSTLDPFRYMTSGTHAPYHAGSAGSLRNVSGSTTGGGYYEPSVRGGGRAPRRESRHLTPDDGDYEPSTRGGARAPRRQSRHLTPDDGDVSSSEVEWDVDKTSDEADDVVRKTRPRMNGRDEIIVQEDREPYLEPRVTRSKKSSPSSPSSSRSSPKPSKRRDTGGSKKRLSR